MTPSFRSPWRIANRARKGSVLIISLMTIFLALAVVGIMVQAASSTRVGNIRARQQSENLRYATNLVEYGAAQIKAVLNQPSAKTPDLVITPTWSPPQLSGTNIATTLGINTAQYTVNTCVWGTYSSMSQYLPTAMSLNASTPTMTNWNSSTMTGTGMMTATNPINKANHAVNFYISHIWTIPIIAVVSLTDKASGKSTTVTATGNQQVDPAPFPQETYYFHALNAQISHAIQTKQRGGILATKPSTYGPTIRAPTPWAPLFRSTTSKPTSSCSII